MFLANIHKDISWPKQMTVSTEESGPQALHYVNCESITEAQKVLRMLKIKLKCWITPELQSVPECALVA